MPDRAIHKPVGDDVGRPPEELALDLDEAAPEDIEAPPDDALEQRRPIQSLDEQVTADDLPIEADPADAIDQRVPVLSDEDDYR